MNKIERYIRLRHSQMKKRILAANNGRHSYRCYKGKKIMPVEDFVNWSIDDTQFNYVYHYWVAQGKPNLLKPSIDRINNKLGYLPGNVRWVTLSENCRNIQDKTQAKRVWDEYGNSWESVALAARDLGRAASSISKSARTGGTSYGEHFYYYDPSARSGMLPDKRHSAQPKDDNPLDI